MLNNGKNKKNKTSLTTKDEVKFKQWYDKVASYKDLNPNPDDSLQSYDYRGFWKNEPMKDSMLVDSPNAHFTDKYKQPTHPTFSDESIYSNDSTKGGSWGTDKKDNWFFKHSEFTKNNVQKTFDYLKGTGETSIIANDTLRTQKDVDRVKQKQLKTSNKKK